MPSRTHATRTHTLGRRAMLEHTVVGGAAVAAGLLTVESPTAAALTQSGADAGIAGVVTRSRMRRVTTGLNGEGQSFIAGDETVGVIQGVLERNCSVPIFVGACNAMRDMDLRPYAAKVTAPTLVMVGSEDCLTPIDTGPDGAGARWIHQNIAGSQFYVVEGSGHTNLMEQPELSADIVIRYFQGEHVGNA